ncbi:MAG: ATP-binding protein [Lachnospiraceae bacterium]
MRQDVWSIRGRKVNKIHIINFGPVRKAVINVDKRMQILIGMQASGKSTVCKVIYFCQKSEITH